MLSTSGSRGDVAGLGRADPPRAAHPTPGTQALGRAVSYRAAPIQYRARARMAIAAGPC